MKIKTIAAAVLCLLVCDPIDSHSVPGHKLIVTGYEVVTGDAVYDSVKIQPNGELVFDPSSDTSLTVAGNVEVRGRLVMRPSSASIEHKLTFDGVDETAYVGGGMDVLKTDVGLWVMGDGQLDLHGDHVDSWTRDPSNAAGWSECTNTFTTPVTQGDYNTFSLWDGNPLPVGPLGVSGEAGCLDRNVIVEGTPAGRAHVLIRSTRPQYIWYAEFRHLGPRQLVPGPQPYHAGVLGRYPLHFHHAGDGSRGSRVEGVSVHSSGHRAFVPHESNGIVIRNSVAFDVVGDAFWWDEFDVSNDIVVDDVLIANVTDEPSFRGFRLAAFSLGDGVGNVIRNSVASGVQGNKDASGFKWPQQANLNVGVWDFRDNVAHNNKRHGIFTWQNVIGKHTVFDTDLYRNGGAGISHGAYLNVYLYSGLALAENGVSVALHSLSHSAQFGRAKFESISGVDTLRIHRHNATVGEQVLFVDTPIGAVVDTSSIGGRHPSLIDFVRSGLEPCDFDTTLAEPGFVYRVQRANGTAYRLDGNGVTSIPAFEVAQ